MSSSIENIAKYKRQILAELYAYCDDEQKKKFERMYPGGIEKVTDKQLDWAITQCENTKNKNLEKMKHSEINIPSIDEMIWYINFAEYYIFPDETLVDGFLQENLIKHPNLNYKNKLTIENVKRVYDCKYKLILRPYSDITQEEYDEYSKITEIRSEKRVEFSLFSVPARRTRYLISIGVDVFDWIKQGKALDKTLLKDIK